MRNSRSQEKSDSKHRIFTITRLAMLLLAAAPATSIAQSDLVLQGEQFTIALRPPSAYTVSTWTHGGYTYVEDIGSCQGTVLYMGSASAQAWCGSCHGNETVLSVTLWVEGAEQPATPGCTYTGDHFQVRKESLLNHSDHAVLLETDLVIAEDGVLEMVTLRALDDDTHVPVCYLWLSSHSDALVEWFCEHLDSTFTDGQSDADDGTMHTNWAVRYIAQYDAALAKGLVTLFNWQTAQDRAILWDRPVDNKLYWRISAQTPASAGSVWQGRTIRLPFSGLASDWQTLAQSVAASAAPPGETTNPGSTPHINPLLQIEHLTGPDHWLCPPTLTVTEFVAADSSGDWDVDLEDVALMQSSYLARTVR